MTMPPFLATLDAAAAAAQREELAFRRGIAEQIAAHERRRQFAFRRADVARIVAGAVAAAPDRAEAEAAGERALREELGWHGWSEARGRILAAFRPVVQAIVAATLPPEEGAAPVAVADVPAAFAAFEAWYEAETGTAFLAVFDVEMPELPLVEI
jgi:hypothetical protein